MGIIKCENGHFYDDSKYSYCPICDEISSPKNSRKKSLFEKTVSKIKKAGSDNVTVAFSDFDKEESSSLDRSEEQVTVAKYLVDNKCAPVSGWLVCIEGDLRGKSFEIRQGKNFVGRSVEMDIALINNQSVTRDKHCSIVFEPIKAQTFITNENGAVYLNGEYVSQPTELKENDEITVGDLKFLFVPYCNEVRKW
ncbi:MAG: FHA domain-containing protein [Eubacterium sp.]